MLITEFTDTQDKESTQRIAVVFSLKNWMIIRFKEAALLSAVYQTI